LSWWFPERGDVFSVHVALAVCKHCPVREPCLDEAVALGDDIGIRGGMTPAQRAAWRRRRQLAG
jgi:WhiB family redox-sensing transcriptional regulator